MEPPISPEMADFLARQDWTYAKTQPWAPHWYLMLARTDDAEMYRAFIALLDERGEYRLWKGRRTRIQYLTSRGYDYWTGPEQPGKPRWINRRVAVAPETAKRGDAHFSEGDADHQARVEGRPW